jgi:antitoxin FitA
LRTTRHICRDKMPCMTGSLAADMSYTPSNVVHMSKMIQVRNVPDELHLALKERALAEGISLSDFIKRELGEIATQASFEEIDARIRARGPSHLRSETIREALDELRED